MERVRAGDSVHGVEFEFEGGVGEELTDEREVEACLEDIEVVLEELVGVGGGGGGGGGGAWWWWWWWWRWRC